jgi:hypothetical protein
LNLLKIIALKNALKIPDPLISATAISPEWLICLSWNFWFIPKYVGPTYCKNISQIGEID